MPITAPSPSSDIAAPTADTVDEQRLAALLGQVVNDLGASLAVPLVLLGDRLGLWTTLSGAGAVTSADLAELTGPSERYLREWLLAMAASGYVDHRGVGRYELSSEQAQLFTEPASPAYVAGGFQNLTAATRTLDRLTEAFRTGAGMGWHEHHPDVFDGTERFFRPGYTANLTSAWIPALPGLEARLEAGARIADVGCGLGTSTRLLAERYPTSTVVGVDYHEESIATARERSEHAGLASRVDFRVAGAAELTGRYDFIALFDSLHDMPDPLGALRAVRSSLADDGWVMLVEPMSGDDVEDALNPVGRLNAVRQCSSVFPVDCPPSLLPASETRPGPPAHSPSPSKPASITAGRRHALRSTSSTNCGREGTRDGRPRVTTSLPIQLHPQVSPARRLPLHNDAVNSSPGRPWRPGAGSRARRAEP